MTAKQITDKIALLKDAMKKEKIKSVKDKIKNKIEDLRQQAKTSNISTTQLAKSLLGSQRKVANMTDAELRSALKQLRPRSEYSFLKFVEYRSLPKVKDDLKRFAKPVGWRIKGKNNTHRPSPKELAIAKKKGTAYYEDRPDRADVVRPAKLEDGGMMAKGGIVAYANDDYENRIGAFSSKASAKTFAKKNVDKYDEMRFEDESGDSIVVSKGDTAKDIDWLFGESYSKMAKGGNVERGSAHIYITQTNGEYKVYHGSGVTLKKNAELLFQRSGVKEGTWEKLWKVLSGGYLGKMQDGGMMAKGGSINDVKITYADDFAHKKGINSTMIEVGADLYMLGDSIKDHLRGFIIKEQKHLKNQNKEYKNNSMLSFGGRDVLDKITWDVEHSDDEEKSWRESKYYVVIQDGCSPLAVAHFFYLLGKHSNLVK